MQVTRFTRLLAASTSLAILFTACSKSNNNNSAGVSASVNGQNYSAKATTGTGDGTMTDFYEIVSAGTVGTDSVVFTITTGAPFVLNKPISTDTSAYAGIDYIIYRNVKIYADYGVFYGNTTSAIVTVTALDSAKHTIQGTFSGLMDIDYNVTGAPDSVAITNGKFNATYVPQ